MKIFHVNIFCITRRPRQYLCGTLQCGDLEVRVRHVYPRVYIYPHIHTAFLWHTAVWMKERECDMWEYEWIWMCYVWMKNQNVSCECVMCEWTNLNVSCENILTWMCHVEYSHDTWHIQIWHMTNSDHMNVSCGIFSWHMNPPKNGVITLWPNTRVVKCKYYVSQKKNGFNNKIHWYSILLTFVSKFTARL